MSSDLVEKVRRAIYDGPLREVGETEARAAIKAVAEFLFERACVSASPASSYEYLAARDLMSQLEESE
ncbi:MAG: hypothetical protein ACK52K_11855 [Alphaproteobacteria bacterium]|jgi:predicted RNA-binding protein